MAQILIVDDEVEIRDALKKILKEEGHSILEAKNGEESINLFYNSKPDLVLLDLNLPGMAGEEVAQTIKNREDSKYTPIIIVTGESSTNTYSRLLDIGVEEFLVKPFSKPHLLAKVRSLLKAKSLNDQLMAAFSAIESLESLHSLLMQRLSDNPVSLEDFIKLALTHCFADKPELGSPCYLFISKDQEGIITGRAIHIDRSGQANLRFIGVEKAKMVDLLKPFEQINSVYFTDFAPEELLKLFFKDMISGTKPLVAVKEAAHWVVAAGYNRSVNFNDSRWLSSIARQYSLYFLHLNQIIETEKAFHYSLSALARAAEAYDENIVEHLERVCQFSRMIAEELHLSSEFIKEISSSAMLHDVGKIHISKEILNKKEPLTKNEMEKIMEHPLIGAKILGDNPRLHMAKEIALCHHEHYDGSGYPRQLKGEKIPLPARIVIIADVYEALRSPRPYKKGLNHSEAIYILKNGDEKTKPTFFDPEILNAFLKLKDAPDAIYNLIKKKTNIFG